MKRYKSLYPKTWQNYKERCLQNPGMKISITNICTEDLLEAVIRPDKYFEELRKIFFKIQSNVNQQKSVKTMCDVLTKEFNPFKIIFKYEEDIKSDTSINEGGTDDDIYNTIYLFCNVKLFQEIKENYNFFVDNAITILGHEFIHRNQAVKIKNKEALKNKFKDEGDEEKYYRDKQEIMAYAWHILEVLRRKRFDNLQIFTMLKNDVMTEEHYMRYKNLFGKNSVEIKRLEKYMYEYIVG